LSAASAEIVVAALAEAGAPSGTFNVIYGEPAGREAVLDPRVAAGSFTGSLGGGRALFDLASSRRSPIPFFAEMGSLNPVFVTGAALEAERDALLDGFVGSFTLGVGQFCTKPGVLVAPAGIGIEDALRARVETVAAAPMLSEAIAGRYGDTLTTLRATPASRDVVVAAADGIPDGLAAGATLIGATAADFLADRDALLVECFGPTSVLITYADEEELTAVAQAFDGQLTATLHALPGEPLAARLLPLLRAIAGRVLFNDWPTGVAVTAAMQHGGPYPATTASSTTSVGDLAIRRFLRPISYQGVPDPLLPPALQDANPWGLPRRVDGRLVPSPDHTENEVT
jgi:NADP-dependent aldehyde dehydrogenase